jgi:diguanylate cyclase (GGDEF)-like protein/PAS domain S-box-containing protein
MPDFDTLHESRQPTRNVQPHGFHEQLIDNLYDGVYFVDSSRMITYWNKSAEELTGYSAEEAIGKHCFDNFLNHVDCEGRKLCLEGCPLSHTLADGTKRESEVFLQHRDGHRIPVSVRTSPITDSKGAVVGAVEIFTDVSDKKKLERRAATLEKMALNDALTGIPNRRYTQLRVRQAIQETRHFGRSIGILMFDLDQFKRVNDTYGHDLGDAVLQTASRTLANGLRPADFLGRWGGEEFLAIVLDVSKPELTALADRSRILLEQSQTHANFSSIHVTVSVGATLVRAADTQASVVSRADKLMYRSKSLGRNRVTAE